MDRVATILIHPNPLFSEGLARILESTPFRPRLIAESFDEPGFHAISEAPRRLYIIGGCSDEECYRIARKVRSERVGDYVVVLGESRDGSAGVNMIAAGANGYFNEMIASDALIKR